MLSELFNIEKILGACEKFLYFLKINFLFLASNIPILLFFLFVGITKTRDYLPLFLLCALPAGPAASAVFFSMTRLMNKQETKAWKDYKTGYLDSWGQKIALAAIHYLAVWIFWTNVEFFAIQLPLLPLMILFFILFAGTVLMMPNLYLLTSRYQMRTRDYLKGAVVLTITKPGLTFGNIALTAFVLMLIEIKAGTFILFMASIYGFLIVYMSRGVIRVLDESAAQKES